MKTDARLTSERFARFGCDLDSRTQNSIVRATRLARWHQKISKGASVRRDRIEKAERGHISGRPALSFYQTPAPLTNPREAREEPNVQSEQSLPYQACNYGGGMPAA